jgi:hypothetical protein
MLQLALVSGPEQAWEVVLVSGPEQA